MKYYVTYIEDGSPRLREFKSENLRKSWVHEWLLKNHHQGNTNGYEIEYIFEGKITWNHGKEL